jgi:hypothetical protein
VVIVVQCFLVVFGCVKFCLGWEDLFIGVKILLFREMLCVNLMLF